MRNQVHPHSSTTPPKCLHIAAAFLLLLLAPLATAQTLAGTPPLGWNSWDSYGLSVTEAEWKSNVAWFHHHLQPAGWQYVVSPATEPQSRQPRRGQCLHPALPQTAPR